MLDGTRSLCLAVDANARRITGGATGPVCCSVLDNDAPDSVHEVISVVCLGDVVEGQTTEWQITLDSPVTGNNLFGTTTLSGSEQVLNSYAAPNFMIPVGLSTIFIGVPTNDNATVEGTRELCLQVNTSARILAVPPPECNDVLDNDTDEPTEYTVTLDCEETEVEGSLVTWTITVSPAVADAPLSIPFALSGDETTGHSYTISPNPLVLGIGETTGEVTVDTDDDSDDEADKTLCVQALASLPRIPAASAPCCVTITDNDDPNSVHTATISCEAVEEGEDMCWTITLNAPVVGSPLNITGVLSGTEYTLHTAYYDGLGIPSVTIPVGETEGEICIQTLDDVDPEDVQQLCLTLGLTARLTEVTPITSCCNVTDNDTPVSYPDDGYESSCGGDPICCIGGTGQVRVETDGTWLWTVSCPSSFDPNYSGTWAAGTFDPADYEASISDAEGIPIGTHNGGGWYDIGVVWNYASTGPLDDFFLLGTLSIRRKGTTDIVSTMQINCLFQVLGECV